MTAAPGELERRTRYCASSSDEFLRAYFVLGLNGILMYSRYFVMAHCLELAFKGSLASRGAHVNYRTHNLQELSSQFASQVDGCLSQYQPTDAAREVYDRMFGPTVTDFKVGDLDKHREELELLICYEHSADLKYGADKHGVHLFAVASSTKIMNRLFLSQLACARRHFPEPRGHGTGILEFVQNIETRFPGEFSGAARLFEP